MRNQIAVRIRRLKPGQAFMAKDFLDIANRGTVDMTLSDLLRKGTIRRIRRGLYDRPKESALLGSTLSPDIDEAARALARRYRWRIVPDGAWAANLLGLSTQVPAKIVYLTDGPNKKIVVGRRTIQFKHARPQALAGAKGKPALVVQALRHLGKDRIDYKTISKLTLLLSEVERRKLVKATRFGVDWIFKIATRIAEAGS